MTCCAPIGNQTGHGGVPRGAIELNNRGAIYVGKKVSSSIGYLKFLAKTFRHAVWLNPVAQVEL